jgi:aquaporin Z
MTIAPQWLDGLYTPNATAVSLRTIDKYVVDAVGTFGLVLTVGVGLCSRSPLATLGIGTVLMALIYASGRRVGAHFNPAITLAAALLGRIPFCEAAAYWSAQLAAGGCAAIAIRHTVGAGQSEAVTEMMVSGRTLVASFGAELLFAFVLAYVVFSCFDSPRRAPGSVWHFAIGVAVLAGAVDFAALFGGVYLVSQVIAGVFTAIAFLTFGATAR